MIEITLKVVDTAFLYFHTRHSTGDEIAPFVDEMRKEYMFREAMRQVKAASG